MCTAGPAVGSVQASRARWPSPAMLGNPLERLAGTVPITTGGASSPPAWTRRTRTSALPRPTVSSQLTTNEPSAKGRQRKSGNGAKRRRKQLDEQLDEATRGVAEIELRLGVINEQFCDPTFFQKTPRDEISALESEHSELSAQLSTRMQEWESVERELAELPDD